MTISFILFLLVYFAVGFIALLWFFWNDARFFWLAAINLLSCLLFVAIYFLSTKKKSKKTEETVSTTTSSNESVRYSPYFAKYPYKQKKHKSSYLSMYFLHFLLSIIVGFFLFIFLSWALPIILLLSVLGGFLFFFLSYLIFKNQWYSRFFKLLYTKIYVVVFLIVFMWSIMVWWLIPLKTQIYDYAGKASTLFKNTFSKDNKDPYLFVSEWHIVDSWSVEAILFDSWYLFQETWEIVTWVALDTTWSLATGINTVFVSDDKNTSWEKLEDQNISLKKDLWIYDTDTISMITALRFLMEKYDIPLSKKTNTRFTYVSTKNILYPYWKTAYEKRIIGVSNNPVSKISCETYQVFKGMLLWWEVNYTPTTVKKIYWNESQKLGLLNGCVYWNLLKWSNL